jgi:WD40 repeat protein
MKGGSRANSPILRIWAIDQDVPQLLGAKKVNDLKILKPEFSYDGKTLFVAEQNGLMKINLAEFPLRPEEATTRTVSDSVRILSKKGDYAATVSPKGEWAILNVKTQTPQPIQFGDVDCVLAFSDSGKFIAVRETMSAETPRGKERIGIWGFSTTPSLNEISKVSEIDIEHFASGDLCCFSPDDTTLAVVNRTGVLGLWNVRTGRLTEELRQNEAITAFTFSPQEKKIAICTSGQNAKLTLWDINRTKIVQTQTDPSTTAMTAVVFSPDGRFIYTGDKNGNIKKWPVKNK